jgi:hypothetical protein
MQQFGQQGGILSPCRGIPGAIPAIIAAYADVHISSYQEQALTIHLSK